MKKHIKNFFIICILFISFVLVTATSYANSIFNDLSTNIFRLHIIANSDSSEDQLLKLKIRDSIINYMKIATKNANSKEEIINFCKNNLNELKNIAVQVIKENGYEYDVNIEIGNFYFPTKDYANISLPAGNYDALRIKIGNATGKNWWCSLFPPLCFVDISSGVLEDENSKVLKENLNSEEYSLITNTSDEMKLKFKIIEIINEKLQKAPKSLASNP